MAFNLRVFRKDKPKPLAKSAHSVWRENINSSLLEFIPHLMRGREKL